MNFLESNYFLGIFFYLMRSIFYHLIPLKNKEKTMFYPNFFFLFLPFFMTVLKKETLLEFFFKKMFGTSKFFYFLDRTSNITL